MSGNLNSVPGCGKVDPHYAAQYNYMYMYVNSSCGRILLKYVHVIYADGIVNDEFLPQDFPITPLHHI